MANVSPRRFFYTMTLSLLTLVLVSCQKEHKLTLLTLPNGKELPIAVAITLQEQEKGLSNITPDQWPKEQGLFFPRNKMGFRQFWMPETFMDLHIYFLDGSLRVVEIIPHMKAYPTRVEPVPRTPIVHAQHVLEIRSDAEVNKEINIGDQLKIKDESLLKVPWEK